ncbi:MAG: hypothetical protein HDR21_13255 [Lachnospiraceae bacterium]|nr:hypothetical protein [Lachnospiraceae bacterium]
MGKKLKITVLWTVYIGIVIMGTFSVILLGIGALAPTFFPDKDISGIKGYVNTFCVILSILSVGLGVYSVWQSIGSGKQANEILNSLRAIEREQQMTKDYMRVVAAVVDNGKTTQTSNANMGGAWKTDKTIQ